MLNIKSEKSFVHKQAGKGGTRVKTTAHVSEIPSGGDDITDAKDLGSENSTERMIGCQKFELERGWKPSWVGNTLSRRTIVRYPGAVESFLPRSRKKMNG